MRATAKGLMIFALLLSSATLAIHRVMGSVELDAIAAALFLQQLVLAFLILKD